MTYACLRGTHLATVVLFLALGLFFKVFEICGAEIEAELHFCVLTRWRRTDGITRYH